MYLRTLTGFGQVQTTRMCRPPWSCRVKARLSGGAPRTPPVSGIGGDGEWTTAAAFTVWWSTEEINKNLCLSISTEKISAERRIILRRRPPPHIFNPMNDSILQTARKEERQLLMRLDAVRAVIRAYGGEPCESLAPRESAAPQQLTTTRSPSEATKKIKELLFNLLHGEKEPTPTRDLVAFLQGEGIEVSGKNPVATLSALLSHANEFEPVGRKGWLLTSKTPDAATSGAASTGGDDPPLFESQKELSPTD